MLEEPPSEEERRLVRNLTLAVQTVRSCGHATRVTVASLLQDFDDITGEPGSSIADLRFALERAISDDIKQNIEVANILGLSVKIPQKAHDRLQTLATPGTQSALQDNP